MNGEFGENGETENGLVFHAVDYRENLYGDLIVDREVIVQKSDYGYKIIVRELNCLGSVHVGLGTCWCEHHDTYRTTVYVARKMDVTFDDGLVIKFTPILLVAEE